MFVHATTVILASNQIGTRGSVRPEPLQVLVTHATHTDHGAPSVSFAWAADQATVAISFAYVHRPRIQPDWSALARSALESLGRQVGVNNDIRFVQTNGLPTAAGQTVVTLSIPVDGTTLAAARAMASAEADEEGAPQRPVRGARVGVWLYVWPNCVVELFLCVHRRPPCCHRGRRRSVTRRQQPQCRWPRRGRCLALGCRSRLALCRPPCLRRPCHCRVAHGRHRPLRLRHWLARHVTLWHGRSDHWCRYVR